MRAKHDGCLLSQSRRAHLQMPCIWRQRVLDEGLDISRKALFAIFVEERKGDGIGGVGGDGPVALAHGQSQVILNLQNKLTQSHPLDPP